MKFCLLALSFLLSGCVISYSDNKYASKGINKEAHVEASALYNLQKDHYESLNSRFELHAEKLMKNKRTKHTEYELFLEGGE